MTAFGVIRATVRESRRGWLLMIVGFVVLYYATQLETVTIRLGHFPNYVTFYNYPANVWRIIRHTPAIADMVPLIGNEWLFETGYMNYDYGHGIAEWSLELIPANLIMVILIGVLVATCVLLLRRAGARGRRRRGRAWHGYRRRRQCDDDLGHLLRCAIMGGRADAARSRYRDRLRDPALRPGAVVGRHRDAVGDDVSAGPPLRRDATRAGAGARRGRRRRTALGGAGSWQHS